MGWASYRAHAQLRLVHGGLRVVALTAVLWRCPQLLVWALWGQGTRLRLFGTRIRLALQAGSELVACTVCDEL